MENSLNKEDLLKLYGFTTRQVTKLILLKELYKQGNWETKPEEE